MQNPPTIRNLRLLIARSTSYGSPASNRFCEALKKGGASITEHQLSQWVTGDELLSVWDAHRIEKAMSIPSGWLAEDLEFVFQASPSLLNAFRSLSELTVDQQTALGNLMKTILSEK